MKPPHQNGGAHSQPKKGIFSTIKKSSINSLNLYVFLMDFRVSTVYVCGCWYVMFVIRFSETAWRNIWRVATTESDEKIRYKYIAHSGRRLVFFDLGFTCGTSKSLFFLMTICIWARVCRKFATRYHFIFDEIMRGVIFTNSSKKVFCKKEFVLCVKNTYSKKKNI